MFRAAYSVDRPTQKCLELQQLAVSNQAVVKIQSAAMVVAALTYVSAGLSFNGGIRPLLKFDAFTRCAEPRAFDLDYG